MTGGGFGVLSLSLLSLLSLSAAGGSGVGEGAGAGAGAADGADDGAPVCRFARCRRRGCAFSVPVERGTAAATASSARFRFFIRVVTEAPVGSDREGLLRLALRG